MNWTNLSIKHMNCDAILASVVDIDNIIDGMDPDSEDRDDLVVPALDRKSALAILKDHGVDFDPADDDDLLIDQARDAIYDEDGEFRRVMSYAWPIDLDDPELAQATLLDAGAGCAVVCRVGDQCYIGLAGGGMDLSWDIATAFVALGFYPPAALRLPRFAGHRVNAKTRKVANALLQSQRIAARWMNGAAADTRAVLRWMREHN